MKQKDENLCVYCQTRHKEPPHSNPAECDLWYDWCLCACAQEDETFHPQEYGIGEGQL